MEPKIIVQVVTLLLRLLHLALSYTNVYNCVSESSGFWRQYFEESFRSDQTSDNYLHFQFPLHFTGTVDALIIGSNALRNFFLHYLFALISS